ncbi:MAG: (2Fe-2S) ferredoxin domain-containing protein [Xenococcaceae cyanobacterium MO_188.B32]|nr:(2Fe-2S) ferredoxin domain-containing protein [Xenococcaceae cyanobacterium MO_188.B32]
MIKCEVPTPEFRLVGTVSKFILKKHGKVKGFELQTPKGNFYFKIPHKLHKRLNCQLYPDVKLEVKGKANVCPKKAKIKLKIEQIKVLSPNPSPPPFNLAFFDSRTLENSATLESNTALENSTTSDIKGKILLCKKSSCWKRGGKAIYEKITEELRGQGLGNSITVKKTGCMGHCKSAPNLVVLPDKARYKCFSEEEVNNLIDTHFATDSRFTSI